MDTWDSRYPFTPEEVNLFALLHNKATKFPAPSAIIGGERPVRETVSLSLSENGTVEDSDYNALGSVTSQLNHLKVSYDRSHKLLRHLDLLLEAHKQLSLALPQSQDETQNISESPVSPKTDELEGQLQSLQTRIANLESLQSARSFLASCSIPSVASSPLFTHSLQLLISVSLPEDQPVIERSHRLMEKCWDNALVAMERVLDRDLVSLEAYLDDRVYKDLRNLVLKPLIQSTRYKDLINHFAASYAQLRINFVHFVLDARLNTQFDSLQPSEQVLHLIERTRLIMTVERREFFEIFPPDLPLKPHLNKILESVGNLLFQRIEPLCKSPQDKEISGFVHPLMNSILEKDPLDPFGLFLKLLTDRFFPISNDIVKVRKASASDTTTNTITPITNNLTSTNDVLSGSDVLNV